LSIPSELYIVASWEPRFTLGLDRLFVDSNLKRINMFHVKEYANRTAKARAAAIEQARARGIEIEPLELSMDEPALTWKTVYRVVSKRSGESSKVLVDISTMPRELIWIVVDLLLTEWNEIDYVYNRPARYNDEWLSRDPSKPRLVYKLAGESMLGARTVLVVLSGFDVDRVKQLIRSFEPQIILLGLQEGDQFNNIRENVLPMTKEFQDEADVKLFEMDAYSIDHGYANTLEAVSAYLDTHNIVMSSLGPKPSAIGLYRIHQKHPSIGLAYTPSREFNPEYSFGIGQSLHGVIKKI